MPAGFATASRWLSARRTTSGASTVTSEPARPARAEAAGEDAAARALLDQHELAGLDLAALELRQEVLEGERRVPDRVAREHEEAALGQQRLARVEQRHEPRLELPLLALRPASVVRRIEQDPRVAQAAPNCAAREDQRVLQHPAQAVLAELRELGVLARPRERQARGVDVRDLGARAAREQARDAGVPEQVEDLRAVAGRAQPRLHPAPVRGLLGEDPDVLERRRASPEAHAVEGERPAVGDVALR